MKAHGTGRQRLIDRLHRMADQTTLSVEDNQYCSAAWRMLRDDAAEIEGLRGRVQDILSDVDEIVRDEVKSMQEVIASRDAELERLDADAKRWQVIRGYLDWGTFYPDDPRYDLHTEIYLNRELILDGAGPFDTVDEAIDAAMQEVSDA